MQQVSSVKEVKSFLDQLQKPAIIVLDLDDTLIEPRVKLKGLIAMIDSLKSLEAEDLVSQWRLKREINLTDPDWPAFLAETKKNFHIVALTHMKIGPYGSIPSMEEWRYQELKKFHLLFSQEPEVIESFHKGSYYKGILFTGDNNKADILKNFLAGKNYSSVLLVDDKVSQLESMLAVIDKNIEVIALQFQSPAISEPLGDFERSWLKDISSSENLSDIIKNQAELLLEES